MMQLYLMRLLLNTQSCREQRDLLQQLSPESVHDTSNKLMPLLDLNID